MDVDKSRHMSHMIPWSGLEEAYERIERTPNYLQGLWYVLSPYSRYAEGQNAAWKHACRVLASLTASGLTTFSPIVHFHPAARIVKTLPTDAEFWFTHNRHFMNAALGGILAELPGWRDSEGVAREVEYLTQANKPVIHLPIPAEMLVG